MPVARKIEDAEANTVALWLTPDEWVPNSATLPMILYRAAISADATDAAADFEDLFRRNGWPPEWRNGVYPFHHYHSTAHEVLGFAAGRARLLLGGPHGHEVIVSRGELATLLQFQVRPGDGWILLAMPVWGIYSVLLKRRPEGLGGTPFLFVLSVLGLLLLLPVLALQWTIAPPRVPGVPEAAGLLYMGIAASVVAFLSGEGIPGQRIASEGYGSRYPVASNETKEGRAKNRRVEIVLAEGVVAAPDVAPR